MALKFIDMNISLKGGDKIDPLHIDFFHTYLYDL